MMFAVQRISLVMRASSMCVYLKLLQSVRFFALYNIISITLNIGIIGGSYQTYDLKCSFKRDWEVVYFMSE